MGLILLIYILASLPPVQTYLAKKGAAILSRKLNTTVSIRSVKMKLLNHVRIEGLYIQDHHNDTMLYAGGLEVRITDWFFFRKQVPVLHYLSVDNTYAHLYRKANSNEWNYQFIIDAFGNNSKKNTQQEEFKIDLKKLELENVRFFMDDAWVGSDMDYSVGNFELEARKISFDDHRIDLENLEGDEVAISLRDYTGGRPIDTAHRHKQREIDTTAFNPDNWKIAIDKFRLDKSYFHLESAEDTARPGEFDAAHLVITDIGLHASKIKIDHDTLRGNMDLLTAKERSGLYLKEGKAKVTVSPNASICEHLSIITNYSHITNSYYAMLYQRFPDFEDYITNVVMDVKMKEATVDSRDVAYFAPTLKKMPTVVKVSGNARGTVANLSAHNMYVTDGKSIAKGDITMKGLPDIYTTDISFTNGEIMTTAAGILKYAPGLKGDPNIAIDKLSYFYFGGSYKGRIENFAVDGIIKSNFGNIRSDIKMNSPGFSNDRIAYSGTIQTEHFDLGALLRQPDLGAISMKADVKGSSFAAAHAQVTTDANISALTYKGYTYHNISAEGTLAKKHFDGTLLVNDSNLALAFYGSFDYNNKDIVVNAKANLLKSNFNALHLTKDTVRAVVDLELNCAGTTIDDFSGYIKLFNIDLKRNAHRLDLDSIYLNSVTTAESKKITIQSNDVTATITGRYQLTKLPYSIQYYLSRYMPNYVTKLKEAAPEQDMRFEIKTRNVDSLLSVAVPLLGGFDSSTFSGVLNTSQKKLQLKISSPYGQIGKFHLHGIAINGDGNFDELAVNTEVQRVVIGDSLLSASLSASTAISDDSVHFTVATVSPESNTSVTLTGHIFAKGDSLFASLDPSEIFLNDTKWSIPSGNYIAYSTDYLLIKNLKMESGIKKVNITTQRSGKETAVAVEVKDLDLALFGALGGFAAYQPEGRLNGTVTVDKLFNDLYITSDLHATNVKIGGDTLGNIVVIGSYDGIKKLVSLDPKTGIYNGKSSVIASGNVSFYKGVNESINGEILFTNVPLSWTSIFLAGIFSQIKGTVDGSVNITGRSTSPDIKGSLALQDAAMRMDYLGTDYHIPDGNITVTNTKLDFGKMTIYDKDNNTATLTGSINHKNFNDMRLALRAISGQFEIFNLNADENPVFYGQLTAGFNSFSVTGPFDNIRINVDGARATKKSHIYLPISSDKGTGVYSYVSFKTYGKEQERVKISKSNLSITIRNAAMSDLVEMTLVLDPTSGDAINAKGTGSLSLEIPPNNDIRMFGRYEINSGDYTFTLKKVFFRKRFIINPNSSIVFNGPFSGTNMDVEGLYTARARLYDLLSETEKGSGFLPPNEVADAKVTQDVNVVLHMKGSLSNPKLTFNLSLPDSRSMGTYAYTKLYRINQDDRQLLDQVASLLLIGSFVPPEGLSEGAARSGAINNISEIVSSTASSQITNIVNKIVGDKDLAVNLKYTNYNTSDPAAGTLASRNELSVGVRKNYMNDRLIVEVGGKSDWGKPTSGSSNASASHIAGDFRAQYLLTPAGNLRLNLFRTNDYDVTVENYVSRAGIGLSWRKPFDNFSELIHSNRYNKMKEMEKQKQDSTTRAIWRANRAARQQEASTP